MEEGRICSPADVFAGALERAPEERPEFLRRVCAGDTGLLAEVESLLRVHARLEVDGRRGSAG